MITIGLSSSQFRLPFCDMNSRPAQQKQPRKVGRIIFAVVVGYAANALLIAGTEQLFFRLASDGRFLIADVVSQCFIQVSSGYLCARIAGSNPWPATVGLIMLGLLVGTASVAGSWRTEPHWYAIALLLVYSACVWMGYRLERSRRRSAA